jgi:hypothetical protein
MSPARALWVTVLAGVGGAGLAGYAGTRDWVRIKAGTDPILAVGASLDSPAITALALLTLAAWGVFLLTRGAVRRGAAVVAVAAALAALAGVWDTRAHLLEAQVGSVGTAWPWVAAAGCVISGAAAVLAVLKAASWPEFARKYDAPAGGTLNAPVAERSSLDVWKALDAGADPTTHLGRDGE